MATRFRLPSNTTAAVSPAFQSYTHTQSTRRTLHTSDASALANQAYTPDSSDDLTAGDAVHVQFVSAQMQSGITFTSGNTIKCAVQCLEANAANNLVHGIFVSIVDAAGTTVQRTLRSKATDTSPSELGTALTNRFFSTTQSGTNYTTVEGDRLVVEFYVSGTPTATGGVQGHNATFRWGSNGAGGDLAENDTETGTTFNPWIEFVPNITFVVTDVFIGGLARVEQGVTANTAAGMGGVLGE